MLSVTVSEEVSGQYGMMEAGVALLTLLLCCCAGVSSAAALDSPLILSNGAGDKVTISESTEMIASAGYTTAESSGATVWFVYTEENYDDRIENGNRPLIVFDSSKAAPSSTKSAQGFDYSAGADQVVLFPHYHFGGEGVLLRESDPDITELFPHGEVHGLSSVFELGGVWEYYTDVDFRGELVNVHINDVPEQYNDQIKSVRLVKTFT